MLEELKNKILAEVEELENKVIVKVDVREYGVYFTCKNGDIHSIRLGMDIFHTLVRLQETLGNITDLLDTPILDIDYIEQDKVEKDGPAEEFWAIYKFITARGEVSFKFYAQAVGKFYG